MTRAESTAVGAHRERRRVDEEQALTRLIDAMRKTSTPEAIERWLIARLAAELSEWSAAEAVHALMAALRSRPANRSLDSLRNESSALKCLELFCDHYELAEPRDGWQTGMIGDPFAHKGSR